MRSLKSYFTGLSANTFLLACASLFADTSTEMLYPILPIFLTQTLGASASLVGIVEGVAVAIQNVAQGVSGWLSDRLRRRKAIALCGYALAAVAKPLIGLSGSWSGVLGARSLDRFGAGTRSAPRDALIAASASEENRGKSFGLEGIGDNMGAFLGPLLAIALLSMAHVRLRSIFLLAFVPGVLAVVVVAFVREKPGKASAKGRIDLSLRRFPRSYWRYVAATGLFGLGNSSNSFLILRTKGIGASLTMTIFIYALFNLVAALASYPAGYFSDKLGRRGVLLVALLVFFVVYAAFGLTTNATGIACLFVLYGLHQGAFRSVGKALAADMVPAELRASAVGWYAATIGLTGLVASVVGGALWTRVSPAATFLYGAAAALLGSVALMLFVTPPTLEGATRGRGASKPRGA
jgi:MFS family permease